MVNSNLNRRILTSTKPGMVLKRDSNWIENMKLIRKLKKTKVRIKSFTYIIYIFFNIKRTAWCSLSASVRNSWLVVSPSLEFHGVLVILNSDRTLVLSDAGTSVEVVEGSSTKQKQSSSLCQIHIFKHNHIFYLEPNFKLFYFNGFLKL